MHIRNKQFTDVKQVMEKPSDRTFCTQIFDCSENMIENLFIDSILVESASVIVVFDPIYFSGIEQS